MADPDEVAAWKRSAEELGILVDAPCDVTLPNGVRVRATAHVKQFGAINGMIVDPVWEVLEPHAEALSASDYGFSCITLGPESDREGLIQVLADWSWAAPGPAPDWLPK